MMTLIAKFVPSKSDIPEAAAPAEPKPGAMAQVLAKLKSSDQLDMAGVGEVRRDGMIRF